MAQKKYIPLSDIPWFTFHDTWDTEERLTIWQAITYIMKESSSGEAVLLEFERMIERFEIESLQDLLEEDQPILFKKLLNNQYHPARECDIQRYLGSEVVELLIDPDKQEDERYIQRKFEEELALPVELFINRDYLENVTRQLNDDRRYVTESVPLANYLFSLLDLEISSGSRSILKTYRIDKPKLECKDAFIGNITSASLKNWRKIDQLKNLALYNEQAQQGARSERSDGRNNRELTMGILLRKFADTNPVKYRLQSRVNIAAVSKDLREEAKNYPNLSKDRTIKRALSDADKCAEEERKET